ncbi:expressed unknown protein [Seminavis robusta]|uniref:Uncharacterized protein n=1 Tax=Seminavis robusta TaxID=568900 RepID=A0A9N8HW41_9STRA|nr:expressed unknown protein [Seminavis robusta]|eukprot:Sro1914_g305040.1 n/a (496) ;mRNA; f:2742-4344
MLPTPPSSVLRHVEAETSKFVDYDNPGANSNEKQAESDQVRVVAPGAENMPPQPAQAPMPLAPAPYGAPVLGAPVLGAPATAPAPALMGGPVLGGPVRAAVPAPIPASISYGGPASVNYDMPMLGAPVLGAPVLGAPVLGTPVSAARTPVVATPPKFGAPVPAPALQTPARVAPQVPSQVPTPPSAEDIVFPRRPEERKQEIDDQPQTRAQVPYPPRGRAGMPKLIFERHEYPIDPRTARLEMELGDGDIWKTMDGVVEDVGPNSPTRAARLKEEDSIASAKDEFMQWVVVCAMDTFDLALELGDIFEPGDTALATPKTKFEAAAASASTPPTASTTLASAQSTPAPFSQALDESVDNYFTPQTATMHPATPPKSSAVAAAPTEGPSPATHKAPATPVAAKSTQRPHPTTPTVPTVPTPAAAATESTQQEPPTIRQTVSDEDINVTRHSIPDGEEVITTTKSTIVEGNKTTTITVTKTTKITTAAVRQENCCIIL